jgi:hypothetical protein
MPAFQIASGFGKIKVSRKDSNLDSAALSAAADVRTGSPKQLRLLLAIGHIS